MQITYATPQDAQAVAQIHVKSWQVAYAGIVPAAYLAAQSVEKRAAWWGQCIAAGTPELLVAKDAVGRMLGWINFAASRDEGAPKNQAEIWAVYVDPASWSTGAGRLLWVRARERLIQQGFASCTLWVFAQNARAIRFYTAAGFVLDDVPAKTFEIAGQPLEEVRYVCRF
jgi:ribosomal protein S18 acetylase RimI-like enzyme